MKEQTILLRFKDERTFDALQDLAQAIRKERNDYRLGVSTVIEQVLAALVLNHPDVIEKLLMGESPPATQHAPPVERKKSSFK